jgi:hypothetical protein
MTVYICNISTSPTNANAEVTTSIASERINDTGANLVSSEDFPDKGVQVIDGNPPTITRHDLVHAADRGAVADMEYACLKARATPRRRLAIRSFKMARGANQDSSRTRRFNPSLARAFLTGRWIYFAPLLDRLRYFGKSSAFTRAAFDFCDYIFSFRFFHMNYFLEMRNDTLTSSLAPALHAPCRCAELKSCCHHPNQW